MAYDRAQSTTKYYNVVRRLTFPSLGKVTLGLIIIPTAACGLAYLLASRGLGTLANGMLFGFLCLALPSIIGELLVSFFVLRGDPLFSLRRCTALSLLLDLLWIIFLVIGGLVNPVPGRFPELVFLLGFLSVASLRFLTVYALSGYGALRKTMAAFVQPLTCLMFALILYDFPSRATGTAIVTGLIIAPVLALPLIWQIESKGKKTLSVSPLGFFRAFLVNLLETKNGPIEKYLEDIAHTQEIRSNIITFQRKSDGVMKAALVVSAFHPGPFLNVGSSVLPFLIKQSVEQKERGIVAVPHGVSGHELNLVSQNENKRVINHILGLFNTKNRDSKATQMTRVNFGPASSTCQIFGKAALVTLTLSPLDMEDIPTSVASSILQSNWKSDSIVIIDSHNSITEMRIIGEKEAEYLGSAANNAMAVAENMTLMPFRAGASADRLEVFRPEDGIGPSGICVFLINVGDQTVAYVTIDGNNLTTGFRDEMLAVLKSKGIPDGEIMTTDSHMVSGLVASRLGYYPVGDKLDRSLFIERFKSTIDRAKADLEDVDVRWASGNIKAKTLGRSAFEGITQEIRNSSRMVAAWMFIIVLVPAIIGLMILW